jgi:eukaryotic-like serine/threonine-protein kinase
VLRVGENFEGYVVDAALGRGGSATVYRAHGGPDSHPVVALKVLAEDHRGADDLARLDREFRLAHMLDHRHIIAVYDHGPYWMTMQFVDGGNASSLHSLDIRLQVLAQIADALDYAHRCGIVHCDVKPTNILVSHYISTCEAILIDFGVAHAVAEDAAQRLARNPAARLSLDPAKRISHRPVERPSQVRASLPYAAPELLLGHAPSAATDEYALACTAVELLSGAPPFAANTSMALVDAQLHLAPPRISRQISWVPRTFDSILARAMAKNPELRYESCREFVTLIARALTPLMDELLDKDREADVRADDAGKNS